MSPTADRFFRCTWTNLRKLDHGQYFPHLHQNATGKNESLQRDLNPQQSPQRYQNKKKSSRSLVCWTHWYFIFAKFNTCTPLHIKLDKYLAARPFKLWYQNWHFPYCSSNEFNILKLKSNICHGIYIYNFFSHMHDTWYMIWYMQGEEKLHPDLCTRLQNNIP